jgi:hypothetical protein
MLLRELRFLSRLWDFHLRTKVPGGASSLKPLDRNFRGESRENLNIENAKEHTGNQTIFLTYAPTIPPIANLPNRLTYFSLKRYLNADK